MPTRAAIITTWLLLFSTALVLLVLIGAFAWWQRQRERPLRPVADENAELVRYAAVVSERAQQVAARAAAARARVEAADRARVGAWQALEQAQREYDEACRVHWEAEREATRRRDAGDPSSQREVAHAALAAYRRGDLSQEQLWRVWRWSSGWDPDTEHREHRIAGLRAALREAHLCYRVASEAERDALQRCEVADVAARALAAEAVTATQELPPPAPPELPPPARLRHAPPPPELPAVR